MKFLGFIVLIAGLFRCGGETENIDCTECSTTAVAKDLTGLDGCGMILELEDGTRLEPERRVYIMAPKPEEDPIYYFDLKAGDKVRISYQEMQSASVCMSGKIVFITCIKHCKQNSTDE